MSFDVWPSPPSPYPLPSHDMSGFLNIPFFLFGKMVPDDSSIDPGSTHKSSENDQQNNPNLSQEEGGWG